MALNRHLVRGSITFVIVFYSLVFSLLSLMTSLFIYRHSNILTYVLVYVDDILIIGSDPLFIKRLVQQLNVSFPVKDLGFLYYFLGLEVLSLSTGILLT